MDLHSRAQEILDIQKKNINKIKITKEMVLTQDLIVSAQKLGNYVITAGMGKAGIIAQKMSSTMASIGIPSFFIDPAAASHGDLGRITPSALLIFFSHSGTTKELCEMARNIKILTGKEKKNLIILITGNSSPEIPVDIVISYGPIEESSLVRKVPSTSTTIMLIIADILAITSAEALGFNDEWFKQRHPGGTIGQSYNT